MGSLMEYRRRILLNTPHIETVSGSVAHFTTDMAAKLKECKVNFLPQQAGSGDPSPSNVRAISGWRSITLSQSGEDTTSPNQITVSWADLGTIYGGFIDVLRGELVQEWAYVDMGDLTWEKLWDCFVCIPNGIETHSGLYSQVNLVSDIFKTGIVASAGEFMNSTVAEGTMAGRNAYKHIGIKYRVSELSVEDFTEMVTGHKLCYKLATPITYPLTPEIIKAIKGVNNVFSDANGDVNVKYWTH